MRTSNRRAIEEFSVSFLDVICCGFGAIILLLMVSKVVEPIVLKESITSLDTQIVQRENQLYELSKKIEEIEKELSSSSIALNTNLNLLRTLKNELKQLLEKYELTKLEAESNSEETKTLALAKQTLTDEMQRLLGLNFQRTNDLVGGIAVDSEYLIFVIDTSGSMYNIAWPQVLRKLEETLSIYPSLKGIQVMNDMGDYMFSEYRGKWIPDTPARRKAILTRLQNWSPFSNSSPVEGIQAAINTYFAPDKRISIYVFGDDFTGDSIESLVDQVDKINAVDELGNRRVRINAVAFPVYLENPTERVYRFAALMRELAYRNDGTFVGLSEYE